MRVNEREYANGYRIDGEQTSKRDSNIQRASHEWDELEYHLLLFIHLICFCHSGLIIIDSSAQHFD